MNSYLMFIGFDDRKPLPSWTLRSERAHSRADYGFIHLPSNPCSKAQTHNPEQFVISAVLGRYRAACIGACAAKCFERRA